MPRAIYLFTPLHPFRVLLNSPKLPSFWENCIAVYMGSFLLLTFLCWQSLSQSITFSSLDSGPGQRQDGNKWHVHSRQKFLTEFSGLWPENAYDPKNDPLLLTKRVNDHFHSLLVSPGFFGLWQAQPWVGENHCKETFVHSQPGNTSKEPPLVSPSQRWACCRENTEAHG